jgi:hypothetical protein
MVKKGLKSIQVYGQDLHENTRNNLKIQGQV